MLEECCNFGTSGVQQSANFHGSEIADVNPKGRLRARAQLHGQLHSQLTSQLTRLSTIIYSAKFKGVIGIKRQSHFKRFRAL